MPKTSKPEPAELAFVIDGETYPFDSSRLMFSEAVAVKKHLGMTLEEFGAAVNAQDLEAIGLMVWMAKRRKLGAAAGSFADFDFDLTDMLSTAPTAEQ